MRIPEIILKRSGLLLEHLKEERAMAQGTLERNEFLVARTRVHIEELDEEIRELEGFLKEHSDKQ